MLEREKYYRLYITECYYQLCDRTVSLAVHDWKLPPLVVYLYPADKSPA
jgi:hypothetical protein